MSVRQDQADGCELLEELRRYYLDTMGIQVWDELHPEPVSVAEPQQTAVAVEIPVQEKALQDKPTENKSQSDVSSAGWPELQALVQQCDQCGLQATRTQAIFGVGNQNARLLIVTEAPNQEEDVQAVPFVGETGELFTAMLKAIELQREEVYISNIIKCHAPENRHPLPAEIKNCQPYLRRQIELLQPKVIYAVGRVVAQTLLNSQDSISQLRERQHSFDGIPLIASFHPAYLLHKPSEKRKAWHDLLQVKRLLAE
ncbi:MAG: uracil-DNA glycosylase [Gammaproteobacteria bacterium]|nr:uracil-DNA glycosylase [Gammaproteobacteria bacterium]